VWRYLEDEMSEPITLEKPVVEEGVDISPQAAAQLKKMLRRKAPDNPEMGVRLGVRGGGCSGLSYVVDLDDKVSKWDEVYEIHGLKVIVDKKSMLYLKGSILEWSGNLLHGGFEFNNPQAQKSCGCGTSFTI
jgi:iron-sulfur cluster assembly protein